MQWAFEVQTVHDGGLKPRFDAIDALRLPAWILQATVAPVSKHERAKINKITLSGVSRGSSLQASALECSISTVLHRAQGTAKVKIKAIYISARDRFHVVSVMQTKGLARSNASNSPCLHPESLPWPVCSFHVGLAAGGGAPFMHSPAKYVDSVGWI